jgi:hypothetical protein
MLLKEKEMQERRLYRPMESNDVECNQRLTVEKPPRRALVTHDVYEKQGS